MSSFGEGLSAADMAAVMGNRTGFGGDANCGWWIILFLLAMGGNWGNWGGNGAAPSIQTDMQRGFDQQATMGQIAALQAQVGNGFADAAVANCQGNANITAAITGGQYATAQAITGAKDTIATGLNQLAMGLQQCCCDNRAGLADLKYTVATEACADRQAVTNGLQQLTMQNTANTQAIVQSQQQGFQGIQDKLCQLEIDGLKQANEQLRTQLNMANLAASQTQQTAQILANNEAQTASLLARLNPNPVPAYMVQNPNCCTPNYGGCGV